MAQPLNVQVYLKRERLPSTELWARTLRRAGLPLEIEEEGFPSAEAEEEEIGDPALVWIGEEPEEPEALAGFELHSFDGPLACAYRGLPAEVLLWWEPLDPGDLPYGFRFAGEDLTARLVHHGGERDFLAALTLAATLAKPADGKVHLLSTGQILHPDEALALVRELASAYGLG